MRKHLLKQLTLALLLTAAVPTLTAQVHVGDILCEGNAIISPANYPSSGATAIGVVFYVDNTGQHGWAVALQDAGERNWGSIWSDTPLPNYTNDRQAVYDLNGYENTRVLREHSSDHPAFYAIAFSEGWYVPAIGQLNYLYGNLMEINNSLERLGRSQFTGDWEYWSSSEFSDCYAWYMSSTGMLYFNVGNTNGGYYNNSKTKSKRVRAVRNF